MHLSCQEFIVIWVLLLQGRTTFSASLWGETPGTSHDDITDSQSGPRHGHIHQPTINGQNFENTRYRSRISNAKRNRPLYTSKTYFGRNYGGRSYELQRKPWSRNEDKITSSLGVNPDPHTDFYGNRYIGGNRMESHTPEYAKAQEYGQDHVHGTKEYDRNPGYVMEENHDVSPGYAETKADGIIPQYDSKDGYGSHARDETNAKDDKEFQDFFGYEQKPMPKHGIKPDLDINTNYGIDPELTASVRPGENQRHNGNSEYGLNPDFRDPNLANAQNINIRYVSSSNAPNLKDETDDKQGREIKELNIVDEKDNVHLSDHAKILDRYHQLLTDKRSISADVATDTPTNTVSNTEFNLDDTLKQDELLKDFTDEKSRNIAPAVDDFNGTELSEDEGSGNVDDNGDASNNSDETTNKSARILELFSRFNDSVPCITPKNESGHCRSLSECPLIEAMEFSALLPSVHICLQRGRLFSGICCPDNPVVEITDKTANESSEKLKLEQPLEGCGVNTNTRIVGGTMSIPHEFSWMVALLRRNRFYCGGVIINNWYILTAAHCVLGIKVSDLKVRIGEFNFDERNAVQQDIPVTEIKRHAFFVTSTFQHDIALLKLKQKIEYTKFIGSICLPSKGEDFTKRKATVVGWGTVSFGGSASPILRKVTVPVWDNKDCDRTYVFERINDSFMCAGSPESGEDACQGDSGGPLMAMNDENRWEVIGIVSWGRRCGDPTFPGVYTRVTSYLDWIAENAQ